MKFFNYLNNILIESTSSKNIGLFILRANPPHNGHYNIIKQMEKENFKNYIIIISGEKSSQDKEKNPLNFNEIKSIFLPYINKNTEILNFKNAFLPQILENFKFILDNFKNNNYQNLVLYCGNDREKDYKRFIDILKKDFNINLILNTLDFNRNNISSTKIRELIRKKDKNNLSEINSFIFYPLNKIYDKIS